MRERLAFVIGAGLCVATAAHGCTHADAADAGPSPRDGAFRRTPDAASASKVLPRQLPERALWRLQERLAAARAPLRMEPRLPARDPLPGVAPVSLQLATGGPTWRALLHACDPPRQGDCVGRWEPGACECAVLVLSSGDEQRSLVVSETAALTRVRMMAVPRPNGGASLFLGVDLYDRAQPWPRVGFLVEGGPVPVLAWRAELGSCRFLVQGDPEDERLPTLCDPTETGVRDDGASLLVDFPTGARAYARDQRGRMFSQSTIGGG